jgi:protein phosphatase
MGIFDFLFKQKQDDEKDPVKNKKRDEKDLIKDKETIETILDTYEIRQEKYEKNYRMELNGYEVNVAGRTDPGKVIRNQDSMAGIKIGLNAVFMVADGMGEGDKGKAASAIAIHEITSYLKNQAISTGSGKLILRGAIKKANEEIYNFIVKDPSRKGTSSTITAVLLIDKELFIGHTGDTRAYIINKSKICQLTEDHSLVGRLLRMGQLTQEEAKNSPQKNLLYKVMGSNPDIEVDIYENKIEKGDFVLLCSDGLWNYFTDDELKTIITWPGTSEKITEKLFKMANERGGKNNITLILFKII